MYPEYALGEVSGRSAADLTSGPSHVLDFSLGIADKGYGSVALVLSILYFDLQFFSFHRMT